MFRALCWLLFTLAPALAWAQAAPQQPQPIPDTMEARKRHRERENYPPPPEGPWGPEQFDFAWNKPAWRGIFLTGGNYSGASMSLNVPRAVAEFSDGVNPPILERMEWEGESFQATEVAATVDFDIFRLSLSLYEGSFDGRATLEYDDGVNPVVPQKVTLHGRAYGFRTGAYYPGLRYRDSLLEASLGLQATLGWLHQEAIGIPGAKLLERDTLDIFTGSAGPKLSTRLFLGRFALEAEAEFGFTTGAARGWTHAFSAGVGYKF